MIPGLAPVLEGSEAIEATWRFALTGGEDWTEQDRRDLIVLVEAAEASRRSELRQIVEATQRRLDMLRAEVDEAWRQLDGALPETPQVLYARMQGYRLGLASRHCTRCKWAALARAARAAR